VYTKSSALRNSRYLATHVRRHRAYMCHRVIHESDGDTCVTGAYCVIGGLHVSQGDTCVTPRRYMCHRVIHVSHVSTPWSYTPHACSHVLLRLHLLSLVLLSTSPLSTYHPSLNRASLHNPQTEEKGPRGSNWATDCAGVANTSTAQRTPAPLHARPSYTCRSTLAPTHHHARE
jgi:hypothetical protein